MGRWQRMIPRISSLEAGLQVLRDADLRKRFLGLRHRARSGEPLKAQLIETFALVREAARRKLGMRHFDVQLLGGIAMQHRCVAEMQTGEGKTLTATLPLCLSALMGRGAHLVTANEYLAARDAEWMRPAYDCLGLTVGTVSEEMSVEDKRAAYACDITYGTAKDFGFDFLRDCLTQRQSAEGDARPLARMMGQVKVDGFRKMQRDAYFALVDEADSILIDEARTPLIIGAPSAREDHPEAAVYGWAAEKSGEFREKEHYEYDQKKKSVELLTAGRQLVRSIAKPRSLNRISLVTIYDHIERAIRVNRDFLLDRDYVVRDGEVIIVDEFTGRLAEGRKWQAGIHQAIEAREGIAVNGGGGQAARVTIQDYFQRYERLAGMTGTASDSAAELRKIFNLRVVPIPTNAPLIRKRLASAAFGTSESKWSAIVEEVAEMRRIGRPVLIGTRSIEKSEHLSELLAAAGIDHQVLNARHHGLEAEIVAEAGQAGRITVSTNMAGRGTDIKLGDGVAELGGLHVISTEMNESARIDRQLYGRCARQGDPGTHRQFVSLEDDILEVAFGLGKARRLRRTGTQTPGRWHRLERLFRRAQKKIERRHFHDRKILMHHENERQKVHIQMGQDPYLDTPS